MEEESGGRLSTDCRGRILLGDDDGFFSFHYADSSRKIVGRKPLLIFCKFFCFVFMTKLSLLFCFYYFQLVVDFFV